MEVTKRFLCGNLKPYGFIHQCLILYYSLSGNKTDFVRIKYLCLKRRIIKQGIEKLEYGVSKCEL